MCFAFSLGVNIHFKQLFCDPEWANVQLQLVNEPQQSHEKRREHFSIILGCGFLGVMPLLPKVHFQATVTENIEIC